MAYTIRWEGLGVYRRFFGDITAEELKAAHDEMIGDVRFENARYVISDFLQSHYRAELSRKDVEAFANFEILKFYECPDIVNATVATDERILDHVQYFESLSPYPLGVFATVEDARHWIASNPRLGWRNQPSRAAGPAPGRHH
jgi:hypothetical protein